jgi:hypothetical protein
MRRRHIAPSDLGPLTSANFSSAGNITSESATRIIQVHASAYRSALWYNTASDIQRGTCLSDSPSFFVEQIDNIIFNYAVAAGYLASKVMR